MDGFQLEKPPKYIVKGLNYNEKIAKLEYEKFGTTQKGIKMLEKKIKSLQQKMDSYVKVVFEFNDYFLKKMVYMSEIMPTSKFFTYCYKWIGVLDFPIPNSFIFGRVCKTKKHGGGKYYFAPFDTIKHEIIGRIEEIEKITPVLSPFQIIELNIFIELLSMIKFVHDTMDLLRMMPNKIKSNEKTTPIVDTLNQDNEVISQMKKIPHFGTTEFLAKFVSEIDVSTVFIPYKNVTYFNIDQFTKSPKNHCRYIHFLLNYLKENYRKVSS